VPDVRLDHRDGSTTGPSTGASTGTPSSGPSRIHLGSMMNRLTEVRRPDVSAPVRRQVSRPVFAGARHAGGSTPSDFDPARSSSRAEPDARSRSSPRSRSPL
jgi:hypothetical protein